MKTAHCLKIGRVAALVLAAPQIAQADPTFELYGHLNFGIFNVDDGTESETYLTDNDTSNTRVGAWYMNELANGSTVKFNFETGLGIDGSSSATMDDNDAEFDYSRTELRKFELIYETPDYGTFYGGQGSMSTDGVTEADLSGTTIASYVSITDLAASYGFRPEDGPVSDVTVGSSFGSFDGARRARVRYDTPTVNGFTGSISWGKELLVVPDKREFTDIAVKYAHDYGDLKVDGRLGYQWIDNDDGADDEILAGSIAVLHKPTGLNFAFASASPDESDASYYYAKVGYIQNWFSVGSTALSIDFFDGSDYNTDGSDSDSIAIAAVQKVDAYDLEIYASYRTYDFDSSSTDFEDIDLFLVGARWKF